MRIIKIILLMILIACNPEIRTIEKVRIDTIRIASPIIEDSLKASLITDSVISSEKIKGNDTIIIAKYYPVEKKFYIKAKPDTITLYKIDTLTTTQVIEKEKSPIALIVILLVIPLILIAILIRR
ncbi:MAG: hypothetical protein WHS65_12770 [Melioribacteraceae bacterium]